jgi:hypothetical protein
MGARVTSPRRFYLLKRLVAVAACSSLASTWRAKQEAEPGTALPTTFPHRDRLVAAGYSTKEDLDGADATELAWSGFGSRDATAILEAWAAL